jgi:AraC family ethanolamine operon transcriptional activator
MKYQISQTFSCFEEFNSFNHGWDADFSASTHGSQQAKIEHIATKSILINTGSYDVGTIQRGTTPAGMHTFALPLSIVGPMSWRNIPISTNSLMLFPENRELYALANGPVSICTLSIADDLVAKQLALFGENVSNRLDKGGAVALQAPQRRNLHALMRLYSEFLAQQGEHRQLREHRQSLEEDLLVSMLALTLASCEKNAPIKLEAAARNTRRALDYMESQQREPVMIADLCHTVGISRRVLELSFKKYIGQSPKQYSNHQRLRHCHEELRKISPRQKSVKQVAIGWGFWHMGQFGQDYKQLFGQTPGTTLTEVSL